MSDNPPIPLVASAMREHAVAEGLRFSLPPLAALSNAEAWIAWVEAGPNEAERSAREALMRTALDRFGTMLFEETYAADLATAAAWCCVPAE